MAEVCNSSFHQTIIPTVKHLYILRSYEYEEQEWEADLEDWKNNVPNSEWLHFLRPFIAVKDLYISKKFIPLIVPALQELVGERVTEALPALECLFPDGLRGSGPVMDAIIPFVTARQLSTHPIAASYSDSEDGIWYESDD